jgi:methylated-DNA-[protein]-cysteine S-methyltransferase
MIHCMEHDSPLGTLLLAASERGLCGVYFEQHKHFKGGTAWQNDPAHPLLRLATRQLDEYFARRRTRFELPLDLIGTPFQRSVWQALAAIPFGRTASYAQQAARIGNPAAVRAVAAANGRNPVSIVVPCHRVIGSDGAPTGYAGGLERKRFLLSLESG